MKKLYRACPVCGNIFGNVLRSIKMALSDHLTISGEYDVVCCDSCGFTYADVRASQNDYNEYYKSANMYSGDADVKSEIIDKENSARCGLLARYMQKDKKILDVGCGSGRLLKDLRKNGYQSLYGIDPSEESVRKLNKQGIEGRARNIFDPVPDEWRHAFDVVMSTAVMEHIYDLNLFIRQLTEYLKPEGTVFIEVPAVEGFQSYYTPLPNYFNHEHINYFSLISLDHLFEKHGYKRISTDDESYVELGVNLLELGILALYQYTGECRPVEAFQKDTVSQKSVADYLRREMEKNHASDHKILKFIEDNDSKIVIWGAGSYAMQLMQRIPQLKDRVIYFVDSNEAKAGGSIQGKLIYAPEKLLKDQAGYPILICSMQNAGDIKKQLDKMGISSPCMQIGEK